MSLYNYAINNVKTVAKFIWDHEAIVLGSEVVMSLGVCSLAASKSSFPFAFSACVTFCSIIESQLDISNLAEKEDEELVKLREELVCLEKDKQKEDSINEIQQKTYEMLGFPLSNECAYEIFLKKPTTGLIRECVIVEFNNYKELIIKKQQKLYEDFRIMASRECAHELIRISNIEDLSKKCVIEFNSALKEDSVDCRKKYVVGGFHCEDNSCLADTFEFFENFSICLKLGYLDF